MACLGTTPYLPLAPVGHAAVGEDVVDRPVGEGQARRLQDRLKKIIAALEFVPEGQIALGEFELFQTELFAQMLPQDVGGGKEPAAPGAFLVGGLHGPDVHRELKGHLPVGFRGTQQLVKIGLVQRAGHGPPQAVALVARLKLRQLRRGNAPHA